MYLIRTLDNDNAPIEMCVADAKNLQAVVSIFESIKLPFKVSNGGGYLKQQIFGWGGYQYWRSNVENWD